MSELKDIKKILVVNLGGIGDLLISTPALRGLKARFPGAKLYLMVVARAAEAVRDLPYVDKVFLFESRRGWPGIFRNFLTVIRLRKEKVDLAINMRTLVSDRGARKIKFLLDLIKPRIRAGRNTSGRGDFFDIKIPESDIGDKYEMEYDLEMLEALGGKADSEAMDLAISQGILNRTAKFLDDYGITRSDTLIAIHPGGKPSHRWPLDNFGEAMKILSREAGSRFIITGSADEVDLAEKLIKQSKVKALNLAGKLNLKELAALLMRCDLYIVNDTGAMHVAAIVGTPLVALFGPGYLKRYDPRNISARVFVLSKEKACSPCDRFSCSSRLCLEAITVEEVVNGAKSLLDRRKG